MSTIKGQVGDILGFLFFSKARVQLLSKSLKSRWNQHSFKPSVPFLAKLSQHADLSQLFHHPQPQSRGFLQEQKDAFLHGGQVTYSKLTVFNTVCSFVSKELPQNIKSHLSFSATVELCLA